MAEAMRGKGLRLEEHCRRRVNQHLEAVLDEPVLDDESARWARAAAQAIDEELYRNLEDVLELWQKPPLQLEGGVR